MLRMVDSKRGEDVYWVVSAEARERRSGRRVVRSILDGVVARRNWRAFGRMRKGVVQSSVCCSGVVRFKSDPTRQSISQSCRNMKQKKPRALQLHIIQK
jgi:hypothetical protein